MKKAEPTRAQKVRICSRERAAVQKAKPQASHPHAIWMRLEAKTRRFSLRTKPSTQTCNISRAAATTIAAFLGLINTKTWLGDAECTSFEVVFSMERNPLVISVPESCLQDFTGTYRILYAEWV